MIERVGDAGVEKARDPLQGILARAAELSFERRIEDMSRTILMHEHEGVPLVALPDQSTVWAQSLYTPEQMRDPEFNLGLLEASREVAEAHGGITIIEDPDFEHSLQEAVREKAERSANSAEEDLPLTQIQ